MPSILFTCSPDSSALALRELRAAADRGRLKRWLAPGVGLFESSLNWGGLQFALHRAPPIWTRHLFPVGQRAPLQNDAGDLLTLENALQPLLLELDTERSFSVQTRLLGEGFRRRYTRYDINQRLAALISSWGAPLDVKDPVQVFSLVCTQDEAYIGLSLAAENLSSWAGGERRFKREPGQVSRSEFKLLEALELFRIPIPAAGRALDLGAAPGGWTRQMAARGLEVVAVDPAELDPRVAALPGVRHVRQTFQPAKLSGPFDLLLNDMRMDARDSARLMVSAADLLRPGGAVVMTLKLPEARRAPTAEAALDILHRRYTIVGARQLFHNRGEITVALLRS